MNTQEEKEKALWQMAKARVGFKWALLSYIVVNSFLVTIWLFTSWQSDRNLYFWPIWPILGWGVGIAFQYFHAYHGSQLFSTEKEYENLKNQKK